MKKLYKQWVIIPNKTKTILALVILYMVTLCGAPAMAYTPPPADNPQNTVVGLTGTIPSPPPQQPATIALPSSGQTFTGLPYTVTGLCQNGLLIKLFINNVFAGAAICKNGSYSIVASLFNGENTLEVIDYNALDEPGPISNIVTVYYNNPNIGAGAGITLTSNFARLGVAPGATLNWPVTISGGDPSYALTVQWGDGKPTSLLSQPVAGNLSLAHIYSTAGVYSILVKATDVKGNVAYLQLVGVANGPAGQANASTTLNTPSATAAKGIKLTDTTLFIIIGIIIIIPVSAFWLGSRHRLVNIKKRFEDGEGL